MMSVCRGSGAQGKFNIYGTPSFMHTHFGFNKGILTIARQYPTPVSIKWKCGALLVWILKVFQTRVQFYGDRRDNFVCTVSSPLFLIM